MPPADIESDPFFILLTDALRAGPDSQQWSEAITALGEAGRGASDEHRLLIEARENLQNGKEFRSVRAGAGFTRKLMGEIETESIGGRPNAIPTASIVAIVCGFLILGVLGYVGYRAVIGKPNSLTAIEELYNRSQGFLDTVATASFKGGVPEGWHIIGSLPLDESDGLRPAPQAGQETRNLGGGVVRTSPILAGQAFAVDVAVQAAEPTSAVWLEAFVSADGAFSADKGTSSKDLVWQLSARDQQVLVSGSSQHLMSAPAFSNGDMIRIVVDQSVAIIEMVPTSGGKPQRLWAGAHELGSGPRYVGVRFLQTGTAGKANVSVQQIKITGSAS